MCHNFENPVCKSLRVIQIRIGPEIADHIGVPLGDAEVGRFSDGEIHVKLNESVRGSDIYVIQSTCHPVNQNLMELLVMVDALKRASARTINVVIPYYGYAPPGPQNAGPITAKLVANLIETAGADRIITMDLHATQIQGFFDIPVDHLLGVPILSKYFVEKQLDEVVVVSGSRGSDPHHKMAERLGAPIAIIDKRRPEPNVAEVMNIVGDVRGRTAIIIDDVDTAGTIMLAADALIEHKPKYACCTRPLFSSHRRIQKANIKEMVIINPYPLTRRGQA